MQTTAEWYNQSWLVGLATLIGAVAVLLQLRDNNRRNRYDVFEDIRARMRKRFLAPQPTPATQSPSHRSFLRRRTCGRVESPSPLGIQGFYAVRRKLVELGAGRPPDPTQFYASYKLRASLAQDRVKQLRDWKAGFGSEYEVAFAQIKHYVGQLNDIAQVIEQRAVKRLDFLGTYHLALIREVYIAEPFILLYAWETNGRWGMRVLRLGELARQYNDISPLHRRPVSFARESWDRHVWTVYPGYMGKRIRRAGLRVRHRLGLYAFFSNRSKRKQNELLAEMEKYLGPSPRIGAV